LLSQEDLRQDFSGQGSTLLLPSTGKAGSLAKYAVPPPGGYRTRQQPPTPLSGQMNAYLFDDTDLILTATPDRDYQARNYTRADARVFNEDARQLLFSFAKERPENSKEPDGREF
jgi:hypothetical protein